MDLYIPLCIDGLSSYIHCSKNISFIISLTIKGVSNTAMPGRANLFSQCFRVDQQETGLKLIWIQKCFFEQSCLKGLSSPEINPQSILFMPVLKSTSSTVKKLAFHLPNHSFVLPIAIAVLDNTNIFVILNNLRLNVNAFALRNCLLAFWQPRTL